MWRTNHYKANDSNASLRRYQKMKYAADNALRILKNSVRYVILRRHDAPKQRVSRSSLPFCDGARRAQTIQPIQIESEVLRSARNVTSRFQPAVCLPRVVP